MTRCSVGAKESPSPACTTSSIPSMCLRESKKFVSQVLPDAHRNSSRDQRSSMLRRGIGWRRLCSLGCLFCLLDSPSRGTPSSATTGGIPGHAVSRASQDRKLSTFSHIVDFLIPDCSVVNSNPSSTPQSGIRYDDVNDLAVILTAEPYPKTTPSAIGRLPFPAAYWPDIFRFSGPAPLIKHIFICLLPTLFLSRVLIMPTKFSESAEKEKRRYTSSSSSSSSLL